MNRKNELHPTAALYRSTTVVAESHSPFSMCAIRFEIKSKRFTQVSLSLEVLSDMSRCPHTFPHDAQQTVVEDGGTPIVTAGLPCGAVLAVVLGSTLGTELIDVS